MSTEGEHLLDNRELNLGSSQVAPPPLLRPFTPASVARGVPVRLLDLVGNGKRARTVSIILTSSIMESQQNPLENVSGPVTGIVEFGNGSAFARIEFDIQAPSSLPALRSTLSPGTVEDPFGYPLALKSPATSGVSLSVPASSLRVYARNDNNLGLAFQPTKIIGSSNTSDVDPTISAFVGYDAVFGGNRNLKKSIYIVDSPTAMAPTEFATIGVPAFAKSVRFPRRPIATTTLAIRFANSFGFTYGDYVIAAGSEGPLELPPDVIEMSVTNSTGSAVNITNLTAVFDLVI